MWTGSASDGTRLVEGGVSKGMGEPQVGYGAPGSTAAGVGPLYSASTASSTEELPFYILSPVFRVRSPSAVSNWEQHDDVLDALLDEIDENLSDQEYNSIYDAVLEQHRVDSTDVRAERRSQRFTTGPHPNGYGGIGIQVRGALNREGAYNIPTVSLHTVDEGGRPDALVAEMEVPDSWVSQGFTFQSPEGTVLSPNTTYAVVVVPGNVGETVGLAVNTSDNEDADDTEEGWSLADAFDIEGMGGVWSAHPEGKSVVLRVRATPTEGPPGKPTELTATAMGRHQIDLAWTAPPGRRLGDHRLQNRVLHRQRNHLERPGGRHAVRRCQLLPHRPEPQHHGPLPGLRHQRPGHVFRLGPRQRHHRRLPGGDGAVRTGVLHPGGGRNGQRDHHPQRGPPCRRRWSPSPRPGRAEPAPPTTPCRPA